MRSLSLSPFGDMLAGGGADDTHKTRGERDEGREGDSIQPDVRCLAWSPSLSLSCFWVRRHAGHRLGLRFGHHFSMSV